MGTKVTVRRFNAAGNDLFATIVRSKPADIAGQVQALTSDVSLTEPVRGVDGREIDVEIDVEYIPRRREFAEHLWKYFGHGKPLAHLTGDLATWNWLSAVWLVCLVNDSGLDRDAVLGKQEERWLLTHDILRYHRHLVSGPFFAYEANHENPDRAMCLLATPVNAPGEVVERIAGKRSLAIGSVCHLATSLYYDAEAGELRRGHTSSPGNPKAFSYYFSQLDVNVDYLGMSVDALLDILPKNFERWVKLAKVGRSQAAS